ncbi:hypothetical protein CTAYLR_002736 [Chrysophaeum taylorii]|uniref:Sugar transporter SWEET1 n=1 Tax=Chrysophaeum taylorii TaxID=2483200 RepID=A0AAD7XJU4_9STRA|nr:hypothetical protein CTAYLR_002736 [Chrysophaeum taylorii]
MRLVLALGCAAGLAAPGVLRRKRKTRGQQQVVVVTAALTGGGSLASTVAPSLGVVVANSLFLSSVPAVVGARSASSLGDLNPLPWAFTLVNCLAWLHYAFVVRNKYAFFSNALGVLLGLFYTMTGMAYGSKSQRSQLEAVAVGFSLATLVASFCSCFVLETLEARRALAGLLANAILVIFYAAPLSTLGKVLETKSAASIYAPLSALNTLNGALWVAYGIAIGDYFIAAPNAAGLALGLVQLACKAIFH